MDLAAQAGGRWEVSMKSLGSLGLMLAGVLLFVGPAAADYKKGLEALRAGDYTLAVEMFQSEVLARPEWYYGYYMLGVSLGELGRHEEAVTALESASQLADKAEDRFRILDALGTISLRQGHYPEAEGTFLEALALGVRNPELLGKTWTKAGDCQLLQGRYRESATSYAQARKAGKGGEVAYKHGLACWLSDDLEAAMEAFRAGSQGGPELKSLEGLATVAMIRAREATDPGGQESSLRSGLHRGGPADPARCRQAGVPRAGLLGAPRARPLGRGRRVLRGLPRAASDPTARPASARPGHSSPGAPHARP